MLTEISFQPWSGVHVAVGNGCSEFNCKKRPVSGNEAAVVKKNNNNLLN